MLLSGAGAFEGVKDALASALTVAMLGEGRYLSPGWVVGVTIIMLSTFLLRWRPGVGKIKQGFILHVATFSLLWGMTGFGQKAIADQISKPTTFMLAWYLGSMLTAWAVVAIQSARRVEFSTRPPLKWIFVGAFCATWAMYARFGALMVAPQVTTAPAMMAASVIGPAIVGLIFFKEFRQASRRELACLAGVVVGGLLTMI
jgi:hypothetical protein